MESVEALKILLFIIPGLFVVYFVDTFTLRKSEATQFDKFAEALIYSLVIYVAQSALTGKLSGIDIDSGSWLKYSGMDLLKLLALTFALSLLLTLFKHKDYYMSLMHRLGLTHLTGKRTTWQEAFNSFADYRYVYVQLEDGKTYVGSAKFYEDAEEGNILMGNPKLLADKKYIDLGARAMLFTTKAGIKMVRFMRSEKEARAYQNEQKGQQS